MLQTQNVHLGKISTVKLLRTPSCAEPVYFNSIQSLLSVYSPECVTNMSFHLLSRWIIKEWMKLQSLTFEESEKQFESD